MPHAYGFVLVNIRKVFWATTPRTLHVTPTASPSRDTETPDEGSSKALKQGIQLMGATGAAREAVYIVDRVQYCADPALQEWIVQDVVKRAHAPAIIAAS